MFMITLGKRNNVNAILEVATDHCGSMVNLFRLFPGLFKIIVPQRESGIAYSC